MALTIHDWEINKNAVVIRYPHLVPYGPAYIGEKPVSCVVCFHGYFISASIYDKRFRVYKSGTNIYKLFSTLRQAKCFILDRVNKERNLFI